MQAEQDVNVSQEQQDNDENIKTALTNNTARFVLSSCTNIESGLGPLNFIVSRWLASAPVDSEGINTPTFSETP